MIVSRPPRAALRPFVELLWASEVTAPTSFGPRRELVMPTGATHIAIRLTDDPVRLFGGRDDTVGHTVGCAVVGGARAAPYIKDISCPTPTVGAVLRPGAAALVLGAPADLFAESHTRLEDVWGRAVSEARERLEEAASAHERLDVFEAILVARVPRIRGIHPAVAHAVMRLHASGDVRRVVEETGHSHRHFIRLFSEAVGLTPKLYSRIVRFGRVLERLSAEPAASWAHVAADAGYADQSHFNRDFRTFAGVSPGRYRGLAPTARHHVPL